MNAFDPTQMPTPEERAALRPWFIAWSAAVMLEIATGCAVFAYLFIPDQLNRHLLILGFVLGVVPRRLLFVIFNLKIDQMRGQSPNWKQLLRSLFITSVLIVGGGYVYFTGMLVNVDQVAPLP